PLTGQQRAELRSEPDHFPSWYRGVGVSRDGRLIVADRIDGRGVRVWEGATGRLVAELPGTRAPFAFTPDGRRLLTAMPGVADATATVAKLWDLDTGRELFELPGHR